MLCYDQPGSPYNAPGAPNASPGRLSEIQITQYQHDLLSRLTRKTQVLAGGGTKTASYAAGTNRLTGVTTAGDSSAAIGYGYDATGAITSATRQGTTHHLHYGADGRIARLTASGNAADLQAVSYHYNGLGQRIAKTDTRASTSAPHIEHTLYSDEDGTQLLGTYGNQRSAGSAAPAGESDSTEVIYLPTAAGLMPIAAHINGRLYAIHTDHLNTPRRLTNAQGQVAWQWLVTGFGEVNPTTGAGGYLQQGNGYTYSEPVTFHLRYPGQQWDEETGLAYNLHRYYDAQSGRYIQADPIGLEGGWNRFLYAGANPLSFTDALGLQHDVHPLRPNWPDWMQPTQPNRNCATAECAAGLLPVRRTEPEMLKDFNKDPCVQDYLRSNYGTLTANTLVPGFSLLSYVPGSGTAADAWTSTFASAATKGLLVGGPLAVSATVDALSLATGMAGGTSSSALLSVGSAANTMALRSGQALAVGGLGVASYATTANVMALTSCSCRR